MRIGIDCRLWNESGVGRYIRNLVWELSKTDHNNQYILFVRDENEVRPRKLLQEVNIRWHTLREQLRLPTILNKEKLDLVHFPYFSVPIFYNKPFVVTIHDLILHHFPTGEASTLPLPLYQLKLLGYKFVISQAAKRAKKIITVSNTTKKEIVEHLGVSPDKIVVTYEGVDEQIQNSKFKIPARRCFASSDAGGRDKFKIQNNKYFLYVGNAYPHKNLERLLIASSTINNEQSLPFSGKKRQQSTIKLVLVGKEDYFYKRLKKKVKTMGVVDNVLFFGEASDEELTALYKNAKALVIPSFMEGFGLPALEAMANKCLVLASDIPALREICSDAAIYFNPYDIETITNKLKAVTAQSDSSMYQTKIKKGLERAKMFSWEKMAKETLRVYQSI